MESWFEATLTSIVFAVAVWHLARIAVRKVLWRHLISRPTLFFALAVTGCGLAAALVLAALYSPFSRRVVTLATAAVLLAAFWRGRASYGVGRGLAPGSLDIASSLDALEARTFYGDGAARYGPVWKTSQYGQPVVCVYGLELARSLILDHAQDLDPATLPYTRLIPKGALRYMKREDHRGVAALFRTAIAAADLESTETVVRRIFQQELLRLVATGESQAQGVRVNDALDRALFATMTRILYGLDPSDPFFGEVEVAARTLDFRRSVGRVQRQRLLRGLDAIATTLRRATHVSGSIAPTSVLAEILERDASALNDPSVTANLVLISRMAQLDTAGLFEWVWKMLCDHPVWAARVREQGKVHGVVGVRDADLATRIVMETLRLERSEYLYRRAAREFEFSGYRVPKGWLIRVCIQESHRDPAVFPRPDEFSPDRFAERVYPRTAYAPLGVDAHGCMGTAIIHFVGRIFVEELVHGFRWKVIADGPLEKGLRHWDHWRPSSRWRLALRAI